jgi:wyosine [tRNA(Phe)-imidazoG37] synthetase (radical SAM superfamily)
MNKVQGKRLKVQGRAALNLEPSLLTTHDHRRDIAGLKYIYPVVSRRAGGISIGVNVNTNNACNWRCVYCQVPDLIRGGAPELDMDLLEKELRFILYDTLRGDFFERFQVPAEQREIKDIAISGNGEPTSVKGFAEMVALIGNIAAETGLHHIAYVLITNGSLIHLPDVQRGLVALSRYRGQVWFKLDSATAEGQKRINNAALGLPKHIDNLLTAARLCPTWIQTCLFDIQGRGLSEREKTAYLDLLRRIKNEADFPGVLLYTLARPSYQPEASSLSKLPEHELQAFAADIKALGFNVRVSG